MKNLNVNSMKINQNRTSNLNSSFQHESFFLFRQVNICRKHHHHNREDNFYNFAIPNSSELELDDDLPP